MTEQPERVVLQSERMSVNRTLQERTIANTERFPDDYGFGRIFAHNPPIRVYIVGVKNGQASEEEDD